MRAHLDKYVKKYNKLSEKEEDGLDLLECRMDNDDPKSNRIVDRQLLADYLTLEVAKSNYRLQWLVAIFASASILSVTVEVLRALNVVH